MRVEFLLLTYVLLVYHLRQIPPTVQSESVRKYIKCVCQKNKGQFTCYYCGGCSGSYYIEAKACYTMLLATYCTL